MKKVIKSENVVMDPSRMFTVPIGTDGSQQLIRQIASLKHTDSYLVVKGLAELEPMVLLEALLHSVAKKGYKAVDTEPKIGCPIYLNVFGHSELADNHYELVLESLHEEIGRSIITWNTKSEK